MLFFEKLYIFKSVICTLLRIQLNYTAYRVVTSTQKSQFQFKIHNINILSPSKTVEVYEFATYKNRS